MYFPLTTLQLTTAWPKCEIRWRNDPSLFFFLGSLGLAQQRTTVIGSKKYKQARAFFFPIGHEKSFILLTSLDTGELSSIKMLLWEPGWFMIVLYFVIYNTRLELNEIITLHWTSHCICNIYTTQSVSTQWIWYVNNRPRSRIPPLRGIQTGVPEPPAVFSGRPPNLEYEFKRLDPEKAHKTKTNGPHQISSPHQPQPLASQSVIETSSSAGGNVKPKHVPPFGTFLRLQRSYEATS